MSNGKCGLCGRRITFEKDLQHWCKRCELLAIPECAMHAHEVIDICTFCKEEKEKLWKIQGNRVDLALDRIREGLRKAMKDHPGQEADCKIEITLTFRPKAEKIEIKCKLGEL